MVHRGLRRLTSKKGVVTVEDISASVHAIILAGGPADNPLARYRAMPSIELGARRLERDPSVSMLPSTKICRAGRLACKVSSTFHRCSATADSRAVLHPGSNTQLIDVTIGNCIRSGINKLCATWSPSPTRFFCTGLATCSA